MDSRWRLDGQRALVTGGAQGIGRATVEEFLALGAEVVSADVVSGPAAPGLLQIFADLASEGGREELLAALPPSFTALDIVVNNAGRNIRKYTSEVSLKEYRQVTELNQTAAWDLGRLLYPRLKAGAQQRPSGAAVVNVASVAGLMSVGSGSPYSMTKAAVAHLARYWAVEWAKDRIRVNAVAPGWTRTPLTARIQASTQASNVIAQQTPWGRLAEPEEIAAAIAFLCLPAASYLSGAVLPVDGAMSAYSMDITAALG
ncbi:MAG: SDR family oxidoreductase [Bryobacter sp.]|nr:SDR family oxidoreductase [Bryobacter sp.]